MKTIAIKPLARGFASILLVTTLLAAFGSAAAHRHTVTDAEMRDLRNLARGAHTVDTAPVIGFTAAELRDLRAAARDWYAARGIGSSQVSLTQREMRDLRQEARNAPAFGRSPVAAIHPAFTEAELHDLRELARLHGMSDDAGLAAGAR